MSSFHCEHCGAACHDTPRGYVTGCEHYPPTVVDHGPQRQPSSPAKIRAELRQLLATMNEAASGKAK